MPWPTYSHRFHAHHGTGPWTWTVPDGKTAVVKCVTAYNGDVAAGTAYLQLDDLTVFLTAVPGAGSVLQPGLMLVFNEGEVMRAGTTNASIRMTVNGYLLTNPVEREYSESIEARAGAGGDRGRRAGGAE